MSEQTPESGNIHETPREPGQFSEGGSLSHSAQSLGIEVTDSFVPPTMALDAYEPESE